MVETTFYTLRQFGLIGLHYAAPTETPSVYAASIPLSLMLWSLAGVAVFAYLVGSFLPATMLAKYHDRDALCASGTPDAGILSLYRVHGKRVAAVAWGLEVLQGLFIYTAGMLTLGAAGGYVGALFCAIGQVFPLYTHFRGAKSIVPIATLVLCLSPLVFAVLIGILAVIALWTKYLSLGLLISILLFPLLSARMTTPAAFQGICTVLIALLLVFQYRTNIARLLSGKEPKFSFPKKSKPVSKEPPAQNGGR